MDELHATALTKLCRICSQVIVSHKNKSKVEKYGEALFAVYRLDVDDDEAAVHPPSICNKCRMSVTRAFQCMQSGKMFTGTLPVLRHFSHHQHRCNVCSTYSGHLQALRPVVTSEQPSTSEHASGSPTIQTAKRSLDFPTTAGDIHQSSASGAAAQPPIEPDRPFISVPDPGLAPGGVKRVWNAKTSLKNVDRTYARRRTKKFADALDDLCAVQKESKKDVLYFLLTDCLRESKDSRLKEVMASWQEETSTEDLSVDQCLAMRVTTMTSKNRYRELYSQMKGGLKPLRALDEAEKSYMPGSVRFKLEGGADLIKHTPVKAGKTHVEYGQLSFEPELVAACDLHVAAEIPRPNFKAVQWPYAHAIAKTLEELDEDIAQGMEAIGLSPADDHVVITTIKDGADGMGDVDIIRERSERLLPDKAFRAAFTVLRCEVEVEGERCTVYEPQDPNSVFVTRPLVEAIGDENNAASANMLLDGMEYERSIMKEKEMVVNAGINWRRHRLIFYNSMIDEKLDRAQSGLQGSGSRFLCTLCNATRDTARTHLGEFSISRNLDVMGTMAEYVQVNPDKKGAAELSEIAEGVKDYSSSRVPPMFKLLDATHADINMGSFFKKLIICEIARIQSWTISESLKPGFEQAEKDLDSHLHAKLGLVPKLMMPGNYARTLFSVDNHSCVLELVPDEDRRTKLGQLLSLFCKMRPVYRAHHPNVQHVPSYKATGVRMGELLRESFPYASWPNYLHKVIEHVQEPLQMQNGPHTIGALSGEGNEGANKVFRDLRRHFSRKSSAITSLRDTMWFHWLYTSPKLRRIAKDTARRRCSNCQQLGHSVANCTLMPSTSK